MSTTYVIPPTVGNKVAGFYHSVEYSGVISCVRSMYGGNLAIAIELDKPITVYGTSRTTILEEWIFDINGFSGESKVVA